jgi:ABC-type bacteriocin/lantibiotic exporter with double-glycine peptidase domain
MSNPPKPVALRFWNYVRRYKSLLGISALGNLITVTIATMAPLFVKLVIDEAIPGRNMPFLAGIVLVFLALEAVRYFVGYGHTPASELSSTSAASCSTTCRCFTFRFTKPSARRAW